MSSDSLKIAEASGETDITDTQDLFSDDFEQLKKRCDQLEQQCRTLASENEKLCSALAVVLDEIGKIKTKTDSNSADLNSRVSTLQKTMDALQSTSQSAKDESRTRVENPETSAALIAMRDDINKLKSQSGDKITRMMLELESKINSHTKAIDATSKKIFEMNTSVSSYIQQPMSHTLIDTLRKQISDEITTHMNGIMELHRGELLRLLDEKISGVLAQVHNAKRFMFR